MQGTVGRINRAANTAFIGGDDGNQYFVTDPATVETFSWQLRVSFDVQQPNNVPVNIVSLGRYAMPWRQRHGGIPSYIPDGLTPDEEFTTP
jgi:hypothetical protein